jgi:hypothetical protein
VLLIDDTLRWLQSVRDRTLWLHSAALEQRRQETVGRGRGSHADPTAGAVVDPWSVDLRRAHAEVVRRLRRIRREADTCDAILARAEGREPDHPWQDELGPRTVSDAEYRKAVASQTKRRANGTAYPD